MNRSTHRRSALAATVAALTTALTTTMLGPPASDAAAAPASDAARQRPVEYTDLHTVSGWGGFDYGQSRPPASLAGADVVDVAAGSDHSLAVTADGVVQGWGWNGEGQARPPAALRDGTWRASAVAAGDHHSLAVLDDGGVVAWGADGEADEGQTDVPDVIEGPLPFLRVDTVAAGAYHSLALTGGGTVFAWGAQERHEAVDEGQVDVPTPLTDGSRTVVDVAAGSRHSLAVDDQGLVWAWGGDDQGQTSVPEALDGVQVVDVAASGAASMALTNNGDIVVWGDGGTGVRDVPLEVHRAEVEQIDLGAETAAVLTTDGRVLTWGDAATPVPAAIARHAPFTDVAAGGRHELVVHRQPLAQTRLTLAAPGRARAGQRVRLRVALVGVQAGSVDVLDGRRRVGTVRVRSTGRTPATGTLVLRSLAPGVHRLRARYAGDDLAAAATSPIRTVRVSGRR